MFDDGNPEREGQFNALSIPETRWNTVVAAVEALAALDGIKETIAQQVRLGQIEVSPLPPTPETVIYRSPTPGATVHNLEEIRAAAKQHSKPKGGYGVIDEAA